MKLIQWFCDNETQFYFVICYYIIINQNNKLFSFYTLNFQEEKNNKFNKEFNKRIINLKLITHFTTIIDGSQKTLSLKKYC